MHKINLSLPSIFGIIAILLLASCGGGDKDNSTTQQTPPPEGETTTPPPPQNHAPVAKINNYGLGRVGSTYTLYGDKSFDSDGDPITATWSIDSRPVGSTTNLFSQNGLNISFSPDVAGDYLITLVIDDGTESSSTSLTFTGATPISGDLVNDLVLTADDTPYILTGDITVPQGISMTIEAGVEVIATQSITKPQFSSAQTFFPTISVSGILYINGNSTSLVTLSDTRIKSRSRGHLSIKYADIRFHRTQTGSTIIAGIDTISSTSGKVSIADSNFRGDLVLDIYNPNQVSYIERNYFETSQTVYVSSGFLSSHVYVNDNFFNRTQLNLRTTMDQYVHVTGNTFNKTNDYAVYMKVGSTTASGVFDASNNYWGTDDKNIIQSMIYDGYVNGYSSDVVAFEPYLLAKSPDAPSVR